MAGSAAPFTMKVTVPLGARPELEVLIVVDRVKGVPTVGFNIVLVTADMLVVAGVMLNAAVAELPVKLLSPG